MIKLDNEIISVLQSQGLETDRETVESSLMKTVLMVE